MGSSVLAMDVFASIRPWRAKLRQTIYWSEHSFAEYRSLNFHRCARFAGTVSSS